MSVLERLWAYVTLGAMGSLWGEASPLLGGLAAHDRNLYLWPVVVAVAVGTWLGVMGFYWLGRWRGRWVRKRWRKARPLILRSVKLVRRHPWRASLASRFAYGVRIALPIACGIGRVPLLIYAIGTAISSLVWSIVFTVLGWIMKHARSRALELAGLEQRGKRGVPRGGLRPSSWLQQRLVRRIAAETGGTAVPRPERQWSEPDWEKVAPAISCKLLATDAKRHRVSMLVRLAPGGDYPPHTHAGVEELHLLNGELWIDDRNLHPGDYNRAEPGTSDKRVWSETGCMCVLVTSTRDTLS